MILISLPVHEKVEVILDQIANFRKFAPEAGIIIHPARQLVENHPQFSDILCGIDGVWVNTKPFYTGFGMVLKCHLSNFIQATTQEIPFTHFSLHASNDMFVRRGMENYIHAHDYGFFQFDLDAQTLGFTNWRDGFLNDKAYRRIMQEIGAPPTQYVSQVEGSFYPREAFAQFTTVYLKHAWHEFGWPFRYVHGTRKNLMKYGDKFSRTEFRRKHFGMFSYPREEFYPANFFSTMCAAPAPPYCLMNWKNNLHVTEDEIKCIRNGETLINEYRELFAVKRVARNIDDPLRAFIRSLD